MSLRTRTILLATVAAIVLLVALSIESWITVPIVAAIAVTLITRDRELSRRTTVAALGAIGAVTLVGFGVVVVLLAGAARAMAGLVLASGTSAILLGIVILILSVRVLRRA